MSSGMHDRVAERSMRAQIHEGWMVCAAVGRWMQQRGRGALLALVMVIAPALGLVSLAEPAKAASGTADTTSFTVPGQYSYTIPAGTTQMEVTVVGASGGTGKGGKASGPSGSGAEVRATIVPPAGTATLYVEVDQGGGYSLYAADGGGESAIQTCSNASASCVYTANPSTDPRLIVAGGGGGGGEDTFGTAVAYGGAGGNAGATSGITGPGAGGDGTDAANAGSGGNAGFGDSAVAAAVGESSPDCSSYPTPSSAGLVGTPGQGGTGGDCDNGQDSDGGGGGAGWVGGSGGGAGDYQNRDGAGGGGGAGASYVESGATDVSISEAGSTPPEVIITAFASPTITSGQIASFVARTAGSFTVTATGSPTPSLSESGTLPDGVTFTDNGNGTATLGGIPAPGTEGNYPFTITATNGIEPDAIQAFDLIVVAPLGIGTLSLPQGTVGAEYFAGLTAIGGTPPYSWEVSAGSLPAGLRLDTTSGVVYGTPTTAGTSNFTLTVTDQGSPPQTAAESLGISVVPPALTVSTTSLQKGLVGVSYQADLQATGGTQPYTWSVVSGALPTGLALNTVTGQVYGTPTVPGTSNFTVQVSSTETASSSPSAAPGSGTAKTVVADAALSVTIQRITAATVILRLSPHTTPVNGTVTVSGAVYGAGGDPVAEEPVALNLSRGDGLSPGTIQPTVTTDVYGDFETAFTAPSSPGEVTVTAATYGAEAQGLELVTPANAAVLGVDSALLTGGCSTATATFVDTSATGCGKGQIIVTEYGSPPTPITPVGGALSSFDAAVSSPNTLTSVTITQCGVQAGDSLFWYDSTLSLWEPLSPAATFDDGCLVFTVGADSSPTLAQLGGTVFAVVAPPTVMGLTPSTGLPTGGTLVTITGTGFTSPATVSFGTKAATDVVVNSPTEIIAKTPVGTGSVFVAVTDSEGTSPTGGSGDTFTYYAPNAAPDLASLSATSGRSGSMLQLSGSGFGTAVGTVSWTQGSTTVLQAPARSDWSNGTVTTAVPDGLGSGSASVAVKNATTGLLSNALTFEVIPPLSAIVVPSVETPPAPSVRSVTPAEGPPSGGTTVTIDGSGFSGTSAVDFGTVPAASFTVLSTTEIRAVAPAGQGTVDIRVTGPFGTSAVATVDRFTYAACGSSPTFSDVPTSAPEYRAVETLVCAGIVNGYPNGTFQPNADVTRAEFVKMLDLTIGLQPARNGTTPFTDVPSTAWYAPYVSTALAKGIVQGVTTTTFAPDATITRQEMAVMLARALGLTGTTQLTFSDTDQIAPWALPSVEAAVAAGYLHGLPNGRFEPLAPTTRADAAYVLAAVLDAGRR